MSETAKANPVSHEPDGGLDVIVVGAGFAGMYLLHKLRGLGFRTKVLEAGDGVGGTWFWNRYPGARVDIESHEYSYSFDEGLEDDWDWSERYATQPELLRYANHVADRFELRRDIVLNSRVVAARFDEPAGQWRVRTAQGETLSARFCVMATGCLSAPKEPDFPGQNTFKGQTWLTSRWPHEGVDFSGKRVAVIGTGSSAIQSIPVIAEQAAHLTVFQRTPNYSVPANNGVISAEAKAAWKAARAENRQKQRLSNGGFLSSDPNPVSVLEVDEAERNRVFEERWARGGFAVGGAFSDLSATLEANAHAAAFVARKIAAVVEDPAVADSLTPKTYPFGTKRLCVDTGYYATFNRPNVTLVDVAATPIQTITPTGVTTSAAAFEVDAIVFAIGFDAMTGALSRIDIQGRGGVALKDVWAEGPKTYLGADGGGLPEPVHHHRPRQPVGAVQHDRVDRAACGLDRRRHGLDAGPADERHRGGRRRPGRLGEPRQRGRRRDPLPPGQFLVHGRQHPR